MEQKVGCTGWGYREWQGTFYPRTVKQKDWLAHYSSIFDVTEVNSSFYRIIPEKITHKWNTETPDSFEFSFKFPQKITHEHRLEYKSSKKVLAEFLSGLEPLRAKIRILVMQLPPSLKFDEARPRLEALSDHLPQYCRFAIEGRHDSWFSPEPLRFLREYGFCLVWNEIPLVENPAPVTTDFVYARLIGDRNLQQDVYPAKARDRTGVLEYWRDRLVQVQDRLDIKFSWAMLNNHLEGFAPGSANTLRSLLGMEIRDFSDKNQGMLGFKGRP